MILFLQGTCTKIEGKSAGEGEGNMDVLKNIGKK